MAALLMTTIITNGGNLLMLLTNQLQNNVDRSRATLVEAQDCLARIRNVAPATACELLAMKWGAREAENFMTIIVQFRRHALAAPSVIAAAMDLVDDWLAFDQEVLAVVVSATPTGLSH